MKLYRDLQPGETLRAGDERLCIVSLTWRPITESAVGLPVALAGVYRRPVDAVPREKHERLQRAVAACSRYFDHCERVSVSQHRSDSGQMAVRMALRNEAREAVQTQKENDQ